MTLKKTRLMLLFFSTLRAPVFTRMLMLTLMPVLILNLALTLPAWSQNLPPVLDSALKTANLPESALSLIVLPASAASAATAASAGYSGNSGTGPYARYADRPMNPASTMKLLTTLVALDELGPGFRWKTQILSDSPLKKDVLHGNLYLRGGGDPNLTWDKLGIMLRTLRQQGLRKIDGDLVLDRSYFQPMRPDLGSLSFDDRPDAYYNVVPDALLIHSNITSFALESGADKMVARLMTPLDKVSISNRLQLNDRPCSEWEKGWLTPTIDTSGYHQITITLNGSFPRRCQKTTYLNLLERNLYIGHMVRLLWQEMGGSWQGEVVDGATPATATVLTERQSDSLADTIRIINKYSDNSMARLLYLSLGAESASAKNYATHLQAADARVRAWLLRQGISDVGIVIENGAGLSRTEKLSAQQLSGVLLAATRSHWFAEFASSLPIVALDGTMKKRLKGSLIAGNARIKTGTLKDAVAIAGYVRDANDANWIVVGIINSEALDKTKARSVLDELISWVAAGKP
ncbi:D-alanyl-D-alanine carboxypeptidase/D-alanyl-D-alanine-endopeptidase [soil metagenome]